MPVQIPFDTLSTENEPWNELGGSWKMRKLKEYEARGVSDLFAQHKKTIKWKLMREVQEAKAAGKPWLQSTKDRIFYIAIMTFEH